MSKIDHKYKVFVFRAIDEPELCARYLKGHIKVLTDYGITNVSTNNSEWINHPYIYCTIVEDIFTGELVGGARIQIADGKHLLPVEIAVGYMDPKIYEKVKHYALNGGISESCGLWTAKRVKGVGIARYLMRASISSSKQLGFNKMLGICGWHTLKLFSEMGFIVDNSLGNKGGFPYPTKEHVANVIGILDTVSLRGATPKERGIMQEIRRKIEIERIEKSNELTAVIQYCIKYNNITKGPFMSEKNFNMGSISCEK